MKRNEVSRPKFTNVGLLNDLPAYVLRFPPSAIVSLLHRVSGFILCLLLPVLLFAFDASLSSEDSFNQLLSVFQQGIWGVPGWVLKLLVLVVIWSFLHHLIAGLRYLHLDVSHSAAEKKLAMRSARLVLCLSVVLTVAIGAKLFGIY